MSIENRDSQEDRSHGVSRRARVVVAAGVAGTLLGGGALGIAHASGPGECDPNIEVCTPVDGSVPTLPPKGETTTTTEVPTTSTTTTEVPTTSTTTTEVPPTTLPPTTTVPTPEMPPVTQAPVVPVAPHTM